MGVGPELPPHLLVKRKRGDSDDDEEESPAEQNSPVNSKPDSPSDEKRRRVLGPTAPPAPLDERPSYPADEDSDSSSDDDYGPSLPTADQISASHANAYDSDGDSNFNRRQPAVEENTSLARDEWMMMPPTQDGLAARMDPSKIRARKFNTGRAGGAPAPTGGDNTLWTETPEQKRKRLQDEVLGVAAPATAVATKKVATKGSQEKARRIKEHSEKRKGKSLYDQHQKTKPEEREDDPSKRAFDREKDMAVGTKIGHAKRKEMMNRASQFGSRFSGGSYL